MEHYVCIHGHFYQPPRENPWLEEVELQDSAYPYHDWNERITEECYRPNMASRILGPDRKIIDIVNNYSKISFDFGPTLLSWLERHEPDVYQGVIDADKKSTELFSGHGAAIAQAYNHIIMPLANSRDKRTQIVWGLYDFEQRFGRKSEGMWLPETAVDMETLDILAEYGIKFTILAPHQAKRIRPVGAKDWVNIEKGTVDITKPYLCRLASGRTINLFFYHGPVSNDVAGGHVLQNGEVFAKKLDWILGGNNSDHPLAHIATDGETFGHHHRHTDMALAYCLHYLEANKLAKITVYGEHLEKFPPAEEVEIYENSSWSCSHGIERWKSNCGCNYGRFPSGKQQWRAPLREAMNQLRDQLAEIYERRMKQFTADPWAVRDRYIALINDRSPAAVEKFITDSAANKLDFREKVVFLKLLEIQRNALLMFTSCGWFFDDISGIETLQIMQYALRAIQLVNEIENKDLEPDYEAILKTAPSNEKEFASGKEVYERFVKNSSVDLNRVAVHFAISSIFMEHPKDQTSIYCYSASSELYDRTEAGIQVLVTGRITVQSAIVLEKHTVDFAALHRGDPYIAASAKGRMSDSLFASIQHDLKTAFLKGDTNEVTRLMNIAFGGHSYSLWHLFKDEQRHILHQLLDTTWLEIEAAFRHIYEHNYAIMQAMRGMNIPLPKALAAPAEFIINEAICKIIRDERDEYSHLLDHLQILSDEATRFSLQLDKPTIQFEAGKKINRLMTLFKETPENTKLLETIEATVRILMSIVTELNIQAAQNVLFDLSKKTYLEMNKKSNAGDQAAKLWIEHFTKLARYLGVRIQ
jgi:alpha-amylase/alpha-mannosidase (GH57 family)